MKYTVFNSKFVVTGRKLVYNIAIARKYKNTASLYTFAVFLENTIYSTFYQSGNFTMQAGNGKWRILQKMSVKRDKGSTKGKARV